ncbi:hypothetical protein BH11BAC4_BH11BAC4_11540 [soil metagenome]
METNFYQDNFEQLLKETTDNFRMYPSKRVWHSIYNDLHPSRKWPSLAIWLLLISSVVFVGLSNRNQTSLNSRTSRLIASNDIKASTGNIPANSFSLATAAKETGKTSTPAGRQILHNFSAENVPIDTRLNPLNSAVIDENLETASIIAFYKNTAVDKTSSSSTENGNSRNELSVRTIAGSASLDEHASGQLIYVANDKNDAGKKEKKELLNKDLTLNTPDKEWIEDYAFHNKPSAAKWKSKVTYEIYTTPSVGYRTMKANTVYNPAASSSLITNTNANPSFKDAVSQIPAVNMELGGNILYSVSKKLNLKIGVQLNYTNYNINAYELKHPTMTTLMLNDLNSGLPVFSPRSTTLANSEGISSKRLNNNTYQISLPVGADIKILGSHNIKWFAGATIQPTYIVNGNAYFISADLKNYVTDNSLMRKWNLNAGIETFISYKTKSGIIVNAGPQFRYQLMSTYSKQYTYDEKLYNLGLKIGIITRF